MRMLAGIALATVTLFGACRRGSPHEITVIARVGNDVLTLDDARRSIDSTRGSFSSELPRFVSSWINEQLLYQESQRRGIENNTEVQRQIDMARKQIAIQNFLQERIFSDTARIGETALRAYYDRHRSEFFLNDDMIELNLAHFTLREDASAFAAVVARGTDWRTSFVQIAGDSSANVKPAAFITGKYYDRHTLFPPELWKVAANLRTNEVSFPVRTAGGYFVLQALASASQGTPAAFEFVRDEVRTRLLIDLRRLRYDELLATLRHQYPVETNVSSFHSSDSTQQQVHE